MRIIKNTKKRLLNAAAKLFAQKGYEATGTREICQAAGANVCLIPYYFGGKQGLYDAITNDIIQKETEFIAQFIDINTDLFALSQKERIDLLMLFLDKLVDFYYTNITLDLVFFLIKERQKTFNTNSSPALVFLRKLVACIWRKDFDDKDVIFKVVYIIALVNSLQIIPVFVENEPTLEDISSLKDNVKKYIKMLLEDEKCF